jgi:hypothetical protein
MERDAELILIFGALHIVVLALATMLLLMSFRQGTDDDLGPDDGGGGGGPELQPAAPRRPSGGGVPLPDAVPARVRLREPARLGDLVGAPPRRPAREPRPARTPIRPGAG